jgi:hypothetical protein
VHEALAEALLAPVQPRRKGMMKVPWGSNLTRSKAICKSGRGDALAYGIQAPRPTFPLFTQQPLQKLDLLAELGIVVHQLLDLADRVQHRCVVAIAESPPDLR